MILAVHATFGAAVASLVPSHPVAGFALGFVSHFALDAIPHRDYELRSLRFEPKGNFKIIHSLDKTYRLLMDGITISVDALVGIILSFMFFFNPDHIWVFLIGAVGGMMPDFLKFLYILSKNKLLEHFDFIHFGFFHTKKELKVLQQIGVFLQFCTLVLLIGIIVGVKYLL
jgi:hypothetical protein